MRPLLLALFLLSCSSSSSSSPGDTTKADTAKPAEVGDVEEFAEIGGSSEGIAFAADGKTLYVGSAGALFRVGSDGVASKWIEVPGALGIAARADGHLLVCGKGEGSVGTSMTPGVIWDVAPDGKKAVLIGPSATASFKLTNFIAIAPDGTLAFSDSAGDKVYRANADGSSVTLITDAIVYPNGLAFSADGKTLYVASYKNKQVLGLARKTDGSYEPPAVAVDGVENVDGLAVGASGDLYLVTSGLGILRATGGKTSVIAPGSSFKLAANAAFGTGAYGERWLYVSNLIGLSVSRVYVAEGGIPLPRR